MKQPEITKRISELRDDFVDTTEQQLADFDAHGKKLMSLQKEFGFDLDVATDIYGDTLLDPTKAEKLLKDWTQLLSEVKENPGGNLLMIVPVMVSTGIYSIAHDPNIKYSEEDIEIAIVQDVRLESFVYTHAQGEKDTYSHIGIKGDTKIRRPHYEHESEHELLPLPDQDGLVVAKAIEKYSFLGPVRNGIGDEDIELIYNPSWKDAYDLVRSRIDESVIFPIHLLDILRPVKKSDAA